MADYVHKFECEVRAGKPVLDDPGAFKAECIPLEGRRAVITIRPLRKEKSRPQLRYYWGVVVRRFAEYWGLSAEDAHSALSFEHLRVIPPDTKKPVYIRSTRLSEWNTGEWEDYMSFLRRWASEKFNLYIEEPNEIEYEETKNVW